MDGSALSWGGERGRQKGEFELSLRLVGGRDRKQRQESLSLQELGWRVAAAGPSSVGKGLRAEESPSCLEQQGPQTDGRISFSSSIVS